MERRDLMGGGLVASLAALAAPARAEASAAGAAAAAEDDALVARAIDEFRRAYEQQLRTPVLDDVRRTLREFLKSHQKYPDFVEVGVGVWEAVYDWHVQHQQPIVARVLGDGRYALTFMFTTLVLRSDQPEMYMGYPYDASEPRK